MRTPLTPEDPRHGTYRGVQAHLRYDDVPLCDPCAEARRRYNRHLSYDHERGIHRRVSPARAGEHIAVLLDAGLSRREIARRAGVAPGTVAAAAGLGRPQPKAMEATKLAKILAVPHPNRPPTTGFLPRLGVIRRVHALNAIGWQRDYLAQRLGMGGPNLTQLVNGCRNSETRLNLYVRAATWHKVAALYDELHMTPGPSTHARARAERLGYHPPLAWDDIDHDLEPAAVEAADRDIHDVDDAVVERVLSGGPRPRRLTTGEATIIIRRCLARGMTSHEIRHLYQIKVERYVRVGGEAA